MLLSGVLLCFLNTFLLLAKPALTSCTLQRFGVGLGFSVVYGALLTKTNRIFRIFRSVNHATATFCEFAHQYSQYLEKVLTYALVPFILVESTFYC